MYTQIRASLLGIFRFLVDLFHFLIICKNPGMSLGRDWAPYIPILFGWDWNPQSYSREGSRFLGNIYQVIQSDLFGMVK